MLLHPLPEFLRAHTPRVLESYVALLVASLPLQVVKGRIMWVPQRFQNKKVHSIGRKKRTIEESMEEEEITSDNQSSTYEGRSDLE
ncbi:hypothetical protein VKT23_019864 [Stygiomarasmius scandens]|uniref:Uncharacterized protein n=1 Tax=Marasmiellus scandens TaxID=2682957 RepID=A0ABR1IKA8_9AGAR